MTTITRPIPSKIPARGRNVAPNDREAAVTLTMAQWANVLEMTEDIDGGECPECDATFGPVHRGQEAHFIACAIRKQIGGGL